MNLGYFLCLPLILVWQSIRLYIFAVVTAYTPNLWQLFCVCIGRKYKDKKFPSNDKSLGGAAKGKEVKWMTVEEIFALPKGGVKHEDDVGALLYADRSKKMVSLFSGEISPDDIKQGGIGNCWMLSALACLAMVPRGIQGCFVTKQYNEYGKYTVRMYDKMKGKWENVTVSDSFPCDAVKLKPLFAKPNGRTAWVHIMEKAFAKFMGSYACLDGGNTTFALEVLTGDAVYQWTYNEAKREWVNHDLVHTKPKAGSKANRGFGLRRTGEKKTEHDMFQFLREQCKKRSLIAASSGKGNDTEVRNGIIQGHAYSVLKLKQIKEKDGTFRLVKFRNPWGRFEWKGAWSDSSPLWDERPDIKEKLGHKAEDDGTFWMDWSDVLRHFDSFDVCIRIRDFEDRAMEYYEHLGGCGPCVGCCAGCAKFWCLCHGCRTAFAHDYDIRQARKRAEGHRRR